MNNLKITQMFLVSLAFVFGVFITGLFGFKLYFLPLIFFLVVFVVSIILRKRILFSILKTNIWLITLFLLLGSFCFCFNVKFGYEHAKKFENTTNFVLGSLKSRQKLYNGSLQAIFRVKKIANEKILVPYNLKVYLKTQDDLDCGYFDDVLIKADLTFAIKNENFLLGDFNASKKIFLNAKLKSVVGIYENNSFFSKFLNFKDRLIESIDLFVSSPYNFFVKGLIFGDNKNMPYKFKRIISKCGVSHIFAISGLHVSILSMAIVLILKFLRCPGVLSFILLFCCLFLYAFIVGFSASVLRACFMSFFVSFAMFFNKKIKPIESLCFSAAIILLIWPFSFFGLSFLLSFSSVVGIIALKNLIAKTIINKAEIDNGFFIYLIDNISTSLAATIPTSIIIVSFFGKISIVSPIANIFIVPFLPILFTLSMLVAVFGVFTEKIATVLGFFCEFAFGVILNILEFISKFKFCYIPVNFFCFIIILLVFLVFSIIYFIYKRKLVLTKNYVIITALIVAIPVFFNIGMTKLFNYNFIKDKIKVYLLKNTYGANIIVLEKGRTIIINCGGSFFAARDIVEFLESKGIDRVDVLILASYGKRYIMNISDLLQTIPPKYLVLSKAAKKNETVFKALDKKRTKLILDENFSLKISPIVLDVLNDGRNFGVYFKFKNFCLAYSKNIKFIAKMKEKKDIKIAIVDEKTTLQPQLNIEKLIVTTKDYFNDSVVKNANNSKVVEFMIGNNYFNKKEFGLYGNFKSG